ncbi:hypothetical protein PPERSA_05611 [Pseudocohnilembus persalinus]|uniref:Uncharacterized protein n=1 Tax=Pseudocohnilembus persalinus TaxID=266149 RepID=A0A0V0QG77_PSEPJ|nr:hypothetical protein PPERSA_05611 [Pseudocohnilembus persalinus]|eukprot:KRX01211.1 hypothetical protein PPERSA_05611 [Pseudocohnilembus persalinus]
MNKQQSQYQSQNNTAVTQKLDEAENEFFYEYLFDKKYNDNIPQPKGCTYSTAQMLVSLNFQDLKRLDSDCSVDINQNNQKKVEEKKQAQKLNFGLNCYKCEDFLSDGNLTCEQIQQKQQIENDNNIQKSILQSSQESKILKSYNRGVKTKNKSSFNNQVNKKKVINQGFLNNKFDLVKNQQQNNWFLRGDVTSLVEESQEI